MSSFNQQGQHVSGSQQNIGTQKVGTQIGTQINITKLIESGGCPGCARIDKVEKVSAVYSSGSQSMISYKLAPPAEPKAHHLGCIWWGVIIGSSYFVWFYIGWALAALAAPNDDWAFCLIIGAPFITAGIIDWIYYQNQQSKAEAIMPAWEKAMSRWNNLYYCFRDDGVFNLEEKILIPIDQMYGYLYR